MKKIKRFAALLLAGVLALAVFTGCGKTDLSGKLEEKVTDVYAKAVGVKAAEVQLGTKEAALNKSVLDMISEDGVLTIDRKTVDAYCSNGVATLQHTFEAAENNRYHFVMSFVFINGEPTTDAGRTVVPVATLKPEQAQAILAGSTEGLQLDKLNSSTDE